MQLYTHYIDNKQYRLLHDINILIHYSYIINYHALSLVYNINPHPYRGVICHYSLYSNFFIITQWNIGTLPPFPPYMWLTYDAQPIYTPMYKSHNK